LGVCVYCENKTRFFFRAHWKCRERYVLEIAAFLDSGRFRDAVVAAEKGMNIDPPLSMEFTKFLGPCYFAAMCNAKEEQARDAPRIARTLFHGMEEELRSTDPSLHGLIFQEGVDNELDDQSHMRGCTLEALGCTCADARAKAKRHTQAVRRVARPGSQTFQTATQILLTITMMDEMYGVTGDQLNPDFR